MERSGQLEQKMLESGIFKLDDKSRPIGIINLDGKPTIFPIIYPTNRIFFVF
jgi:hypothetical protein